MKGMYDEFCGLLDIYLKPILDKNIIVYGCRGGDFIRWFCKKYYDKNIKEMVDRWALSPDTTILHSWSFYYIYDANDIIINTTPTNIIDEFNDTDEDWNRVKYQEEQIINLWHLMYDTFRGDENDTLQPEISYYSWLEYKYQVDLLTTIKRAFVTGEHAHGYFPTDFRIIYEGIKKFDISKDDAVLDIGCGKGSGVISLLSCGFKNVGAIEYTENIYKTLIANLDKMSIAYTIHGTNLDAELIQGKVNCYLGDASLMKKSLNGYNWFFLFNPFSWDTMRTVLQNICNSLKEKPRKIHIFYAEPIGHQLIIDTGLFYVKEKICSGLSNVSYFSYIYESI